MSVGNVGPGVMWGVELVWLFLRQQQAFCIAFIEHRGVSGTMRWLTEDVRPFCIEGLNIF